MLCSIILGLNSWRSGNPRLDMPYRYLLLRLVSVIPTQSYVYEASRIEMLNGLDRVYLVCRHCLFPVGPVRLPEPEYRTRMVIIITTILIRYVLVSSVGGFSSTSFSWTLASSWCLSYFVQPYTSRCREAIDIPPQLHRLPYVIKSNVCDQWDV